MLLLNLIASLKSRENRRKQLELEGAEKLGFHLLKLMKMEKKLTHISLTICAMLPGTLVLCYVLFVAFII